MSKSQCANIESFYSLEHLAGLPKNLQSVLSNDELVPHLAVWAMVAVGRDEIITSTDLFNRTAKVMANLLDEERELVNDQLVYLLKKNLVTGFDGYDESFIVHINHDDKDYSFHVTAMNLMDQDSLRDHKFDVRDKKRLSQSLTGDWLKGFGF